MSTTASKRFHPLGCAAQSPTAPERFLWLCCVFTRLALRCSVGLCYVKNVSHFQSADLSASGHCSGTSSPSDCPYNIYRTSGDIGTHQHPNPIRYPTLLCRSAAPLTS